MTATIVEVDAAQLEALNKASQLFNSLLDDPKTGLTLKRAIKEKFPQAQVRDLDIIDQVTKPYDEKLAAVEAKNAALENALNELRQGRENERAEEKLSKDLDSVRAKYGFTDDGMAKVVEAMRDRNLAHDPEAAAALIASQMPKAAPTSSRSSLIAPNLDIYGMQSPTADDHWAKLHARPWDWFNDEVVSIIDESNQAAA